MTRFLASLLAVLAILTAFLWWLSGHQREIDLSVGRLELSNLRPKIYQGQLKFSGVDLEIGGISLFSDADLYIKSWDLLAIHNPSRAEFSLRDSLRLLEVSYFKELSNSKVSLDLILSGDIGLELSMRCFELGKDGLGGWSLEYLRAIFFAPNGEEWISGGGGIYINCEQLLDIISEVGFSKDGPLGNALSSACCGKRVALTVEPQQPLSLESLLAFYALSLLSGDDLESRLLRFLGVEIKIEDRL